MDIETIYNSLTDGMTRFVRVQDLVHLAAEAYPGLVPTRVQLAEEAEPQPTSS